MLVDNIQKIKSPSIDSTQLEAKRQLEAMRAAPFWVISQEQTQGRARSGRAWSSEKGNFYSSLVLDLDQDYAQAPRYSLIMAVALMQALQDLGLKNITIKWPNDVLLDQKKLAGILLETQKKHLIIGVGVNLFHHPDLKHLEERSIAPISINHYKDVSFIQFEMAFEKAIIRTLNAYRDFGFEPILNQARGHLQVREKMILDLGREDVLVSVQNIGQNGQLIVEQNGVTKEIYAGDLWPLEK